MGFLCQEVLERTVLQGKLNAIKVAKKLNIPFLGICFGMQLAILESISNLKGFKNASSTEFGKTKLPVISMMHEWEKKIIKLSNMILIISVVV